MSAPLIQVAHLQQVLAADFPELNGDWRLVAAVTDPTGREYTTRIDVTPKAERGGVSLATGQ